MSTPIEINLTAVAEPLPDPRIINGKKLAQEIKEQIKATITEKKLEPNLAVVLVGNDPASHLYVKMKEAACKQVGIVFHKYLLPDNATMDQVNHTIQWLNDDEEVDAILLQLPLPEHLSEDTAIAAIKPEKDVDGFTKENIQLLLADKPRLIPGLVLGVMKLLEATGESLSGKKAVIIAKSPVFTEPLSHVLKSKVAGVRIIAPDDTTLQSVTSTADIIITAAGKAQFVTAAMVKPQAIIIDIGINKDEYDATVGDVNFDDVLPVVSHITPVPGGVGPMTVAMLLYNTVVLAQNLTK
jgi:methylenetetrahydrofolate dehydrogenase (NADP+)/methenyltetrahydrofolate cyclohydrolase